MRCLKRILIGLIVVFCFVVNLELVLGETFFDYCREDACEISKFVRLNNEEIKKEEDEIFLKYQPYINEESSWNFEPMEIMVTEDGFEPEEVIVKVGQEVSWKNSRKYTAVLIRGMRKISNINSGFLNEGEEFRWTFSEKGRFTYVDGIVIGKTGIIVVE